MTSIFISSKCEYIGVIEDPATSFAYPVAANHCFHCKVPAIPSLEHQAAWCLLETHTSCPVYTQAQTLPFPKTLMQTDVGNPFRTHRPVRASLFLLAGVILVILVLWLSSQVWYSGSTHITQPDIPSATPTSVNPSLVPSTATGTSIPATKTPTKLPPTQLPPTQVPSFTPTQLPLQIHALDVPVGTDKKYMIHQVQNGENLIILAKKYRTSNDAILQVTYKLKTPLWLNAIIVIPIDQSDLANLPVFEPYQITDKEITVDVLATNLNTDLDALKRYNLIRSAEILHSGDWLLIPR